MIKLKLKKIEKDSYQKIKVLKRDKNTKLNTGIGVDRMITLTLKKKV